MTWGDEEILEFTSYFAAESATVCPQASEIQPGRRGELNNITMDFKVSTSGEVCEFTSPKAIHHSTADFSTSHFMGPQALQIRFVCAPLEFPVELL